MELKGINVVVAGNVLAYDPESAQGIDDILDSLLCAQLLSDTKASKFEAPESWFPTYRNELLALSWNGAVNSREAFEPESGSTLVLIELIKENLLSQLPAVRVDEVCATLDRVFTLPETDAASLLFREHAIQRAEKVKGKSTIALQVSILEKSTRLSSLFVTFTTSHVIDSNPLHQVFPAKSIVGEVEARFFQRNWNRAGYQGKRVAVQRYLDGKREGKILAVTGEDIAGEVDCGC